jgi:hypothetical protein
VNANTATISIRLFEQKIYFLNDEIEIKITIKNDSVDPYNFRIADNRVFSLDFDVRTMTNKPEQYHSDLFKNERNTMKPVFYRELVLSPGEEYSLIVKFSDYVKLKEPGLYIVQTLFYPDLYMSDSSEAVVSNKLTLNVRPPIESSDERGAVEAQIEKAMQREDLPPDGVVSYMLKARMVDHWSKFFLYINLESLYINSFLKTKQNRDQYNKLSEAEKRTKIDWYKNQIMQTKAEWYLVLRPHTFEIVETNYTPFDATVKVRQVYQHPDYKEPRLYTYYLKRSGRSWEIVNYTVENSNPGIQ